MKAEMDGSNLRCECGDFMWQDKDHVRCMNSECKHYEKRFELPKVELKEIKK